MSPASLAAGSVGAVLEVLNWLAQANLEKEAAGEFVSALYQQLPNLPPPP